MSNGNFRVAKYDPQGVQIDDPNMVRQNVIWDPVTEILSQETLPINVGNDGTAIFQSLINEVISYCLDRRNHYNNDPAPNVVFLDGLSLEAWRQQVTAQIANNPSAPQITTAPTIAGTASINSTLTGTPGTVTGPAHTETYQWNANGIAIPNATALTIKLSSDTYLKIITLTQRSTANVGGLFTERTSAATAAVSTVLASNILAPFFTVSGNQASGTVITWNRGNWTNGVTYNVYIKLGGSVILSFLNTAAQTGTFSLINSYISAGLITIEVSGINIDSIPSAVTVGSNNITTTGAAPILTSSVQPGWVSASIYLDVDATLLEGVWNLVPDTILHNFYKNNETLPFRSSNTELIFTPRSGSDGLIVGDTIAYDSIPTLNSITYPAVRSTSKTISAASGIFSITPSVAAQNGYSWTQNNQISAATLGTIVNGTAPFNATITPAIPGINISISGNNVILVGNPSVAAATRGYSVTVTDSSGGVGTITFRSKSEASDGGIRSPSIAIDKPVGTIDGDMLVWAIQYDNVGAVVTWPLGWTLLQTLISTADEAALYILTKIANGEGSNYVATTDLTDWWATAMGAWSGVANAIPLSSGAVDNSATASPWTINAPSVTTTQNNAKLVYIGSVDTLLTNLSPAYTAPSGFTSRANPNDANFASLNISDKTQAVAGASGVISGSATGVGTAGKLGALVAFNPTSAGTGASVNMSFQATIIASGGTTALTALPIPPTGVPNEGGGIVTYNSPSPTGNGKIYTKHDTPANSVIVRAEMSWRGLVALVPGHDYVWGAEIIIDTNKPLLRGAGGNLNMLVLQDHTPGQGDTTPEIGLYYKGLTNQMFITVAYNTFPSNTWNYQGGPNPDTQQQTDIFTGVLPPTGVPYKIIIHQRPGYLAAHAPRIDIWESRDNGVSYTQIVTNYTGFNAYNISDNPSLGLGGYPRIGPYWFQGHSNEVIFHTRGLFFEEISASLGFPKAVLALGN